MTWNLLTNLFVAAFLLGPPAFLLMRFLRGKRVSRWLVILASMILGGSVIAASWSSRADLLEQTSTYETRGEAVPDSQEGDW